MVTSVTQNIIRVWQLGVENYFLISLHAPPHSLCSQWELYPWVSFERCTKSWKTSQHSLLLKESALLIRLPLNYSICSFLTPKDVVKSTNNKRKLSLAINSFNLPNEDWFKSYHNNSSDTAITLFLGCHIDSSSHHTFQFL